VFNTSRPCKDGVKDGVADDTGVLNSCQEERVDMEVTLLAGQQEGHLAYKNPALAVFLGGLGETGLTWSSPGARFSKRPKNFLIFSQFLPKFVLSCS